MTENHTDKTTDNRMSIANFKDKFRKAVRRSSKDQEPVQKSYEHIDVIGMDSLSYDEAIEKVRLVDQRNQEFYKEQNRLLGSIRAKAALAGEGISSLVSVIDYQEPPCYVKEFELHRMRNRKDNIRWQSICQMYLNLKGYIVVPADIIEISTDECFIPRVRQVEPHHVIMKAKELAKNADENIIKVVKTHFRQIAEHQYALHQSVHVVKPRSHINRSQSTSTEHVQVRKSMYNMTELTEIERVDGRNEPVSYYGSVDRYQRPDPTQIIKTAWDNNT